MKVLVIILLLIFSSAYSAKKRPVSGVGVLKVLVKECGTSPAVVYIAVIDDSTYEYYFLEPNKAFLSKYAGKLIRFSGFWYKDSTALGDGLVHKYIVLDDNYEIK